MKVKPDINLHVLSRIAALVGVVILCVPWTPWMPIAGLDSSWVFVLHHAFVNNWQWGKDIIFTFGPYGFTYSSMYNPGTYSVMLIGQLLFVSSIGYAVFTHARHMPSALLLLIVPGICIALSYSHDLMLFMAPLILIFFADGQTRNDRAIGIIFSIFCAYVSLVKFTAFLLVIPLIIISDFCFYRVHRRLPYYTAIFLASMVLLYYMAGQNIENFFTYIEGSFQVASGYSSAMQIVGPPHEIALFLLLGSIFIGWYGRALWGRDPVSTALRILAMAIFWFMIFKAGFTRHDAHAMLGFSGMFMGLFMLSGWYYSSINSNNRKIFSYSSVILCFFYTYFGLASYSSAPSNASQARQFADLTLSKLANNAQNMAKMVSGELYDALATQYAAAVASIRTAHPLPDIKGTVDIFPFDQATVLANGLDLRSRPIIQSYSVYSDLLIDSNIRFLESDAAASHILFQTATIDTRFPNLDEGGTWPILAKWYGFDSLAGSFAVLKRLENPRPITFVSVSRTGLIFNQPSSVPSYDKNLWISLKFHNNLVGSLAKALFKLPIVTMSLNYVNGNSSVHRIIPDVTERGFLLNPIIRTGDEFAVLLSGGVVGGPVM